MLGTRICHKNLLDPVFFFFVACPLGLRLPTQPIRPNLQPIPASLPFANWSLHSVVGVLLQVIRIRGKHGTQIQGHFEE